MRNSMLPISLSLLLVLALTISACSVNVDKGERSGDKKVDIETPMGGLHVSEGADVRDVGLPVYPGSRPKPKDNSGDEKSANINISTGSFGLKVVAVEFLSDDPPGKVIDYYSNELKKYGKVLVCAGAGKDVTANVHPGKSDDDSDQLTCDDSKNGASFRIGDKEKESSDDGSRTELKAGSKSNQHIVSVKPNGKGSDFGLVYVRTRGKDTI